MNGADLVGFSPLATIYVLAIKASVIPTVTATAQDSSAFINTIQPTADSSTAEIVISAQGGTTRKYTIHFVTSILESNTPIQII